jgi:hypothetical protein
MEKIKPYIPLLAFWSLCLLATWLVRQDCFFWDTVQLGSLHAHHFLDTKLQTLLLPDVMDSGHPPIFGYYLATCWSFFGKTLAVSHFAMLPFLLAIVWFGFKLGENMLGKSKGWFLILILFANPILASQCTLVSPDIVVASLFLVALFAIFEHKNWLLNIAILGLSMASLRGMMIGAALFFYQIVELIIKTKNINIKQLLKTILFNILPHYLFGALFSILFLAWHYYKKGWIGYFPGSSWAEAFDYVDVKGYTGLEISGFWAIVGMVTRILAHIHQATTP